jgi:heat shock protein HtpX
MNAFATGARRNAALVAVSSGLLRGMSRPQIEAVLGHEISHVANGDMVTLALLQGVLNTFVIFFARIIGSIGGFMRLFMTHPPLDERIAALQSQELR